MKLRRLSAAGIGSFGSYLDALETEPKRLLPDQLLTSPEASELVSDAGLVDKQYFGSRFAAAKYLDERFTKAGLPYWIAGKHACQYPNVPGPAHFWPSDPRRERNRRSGS